MIKPDQPIEDESAALHSPAKIEMEQDLVFLPRCFNDSMTGELENFAVEREYQATLSRLAALLETPALTYVERIAAMAIVELSRKISASGKFRNVMHQISGRKH